MTEIATPPLEPLDANPWREHKRGGWRLVGQWLAGVSTLIYLLSRVVPYQPPDPEAILDYSFPQVLHEGFARHLQFGLDLIYTYGPWGFLATGYLPATHALYVIIWTLLSVLFWWVGWRVAGHLSGNALIRGLWLILFIGLPGDNNMDYFSSIALFLFFHFFVEQRSFTAMHALMSIALALLGLIKFSVFLMTLVVVGTIAADTVFRHRRFPWIVPVFAASVLSLWVAAGQHLSTLGPYFLNSWRIASNFTEGMMLSSKWEIQEIVFFLLAALLICAQTGALAWAKNRIWGILPLAGLVAVLFLVFKRSFVRHDAHAESGPLGFFLISMLILAVGWPMVRNKGRWVGWVNLLPIIAILFWAALARTRYMETNLLSDFAQTFSIRNLIEPLRLLSGSQHMREEYAKAYSAIRAEYPIPPFEGTADEYSFNQVTLFAHGVRYQPRPVIQSFIVYTPELAELNASHLRSDHAAENLLLDLLSIDDRFPSLDDGLSWPELMTRYDIQAVQPPFVLMKRSPTPRTWSLAPIGETSLRFGQRVAMPAVTNGPVWAKIEISKTLRGKIISTLYKPPILTLNVVTRDGRQLRYRLVPGLARTGFLLSPVIADIQAFGLLASNAGQRELADQQVVALSISAETRSGTTALYQSPMRLQLFRLDFPKQDLSNTNGFRGTNDVKKRRIAERVKKVQPTGT